MATYYCSISLITLAGFPATTVFAGTFRVTTAPAPTTAFRPILTPGNRMAAPPNQNIVLDYYRFGYFPALDPGFRLKGMGGGIDLDARPIMTWWPIRTSLLSKMVHKKFR